MGADAHAVAALWPAAEGHPADDNVTAVLPPDRTGSGRSAVAAGAGDPCDALSGRDGLDRPHTPRPGAGELLPAGRRRVGRSRTGIVPPDAARDARRRAPACAAAASCPPRPRRCVCGSLVRRSPEIEVYVHERGAGHLVDPTRRLEDRAAEAVRLRHRSPVWRVPAGFRVATSPYAWPRLRSRGLPAHWHRIRRRPGGRADHPPTVERADDAADPAAGRRRRGRTRVDRAGRGMDAPAPADRAGPSSHMARRGAVPDFTKLSSFGARVTEMIATPRVAIVAAHGLPAGSMSHICICTAMFFVSSTPTTEQTRADLWFSRASSGAKLAAGTRLAASAFAQEGEPGASPPDDRSFTNPIVPVPRVG